LPPSRAKKTATKAAQGSTSKISRSRPKTTAGVRTSGGSDGAGRRARTPATAAKGAADAAKRTPKRAAATEAPPQELVADPWPFAISTPRSGPRRAVFIDVENTSSENDLVRVLESLNLDRSNTDLTAVGNWRVVGQGLGRTLAQRGAHLVQSAPAPRVPDWSDLWIAVSAGMWLGRAVAGDAIVILSDDRAFDAVGDAAARLGVAFRRITYRSSGAAPVIERAAAEEGHVAGNRRRRRRRRGDGGAPHSRAHGSSHGRPAATAAAHAPAPATSLADEERHAASLDQVRAVIARLSAVDPVRGVSLDTLSNALKAEGFQRPPGSPRLVTRLRRIKDVELLPSGRVRLVGATADMVTAAVEGSYEAPADIPAEPATTESVEPGETSAAHASAESPQPAKRRSRRRGGRRRGGRRHAGAATAPEPAP
jgi:hypothetical protein